MLYLFIEEPIQNMILSKDLTLNLRRRNRLHDRGAQLVHARLVASGAAILDHDVNHRDLTREFFVGGSANK